MMNRKTLYIEKLFSKARKEKEVRDRSTLYKEKKLCTALEKRLFVSKLKKV
jgi:hypothetical protein